jgi:hypothetical protein
MKKRLTIKQCCGARSARIRIILGSWIRIRIKPGAKRLKIEPLKLILDPWRLTMEAWRLAVNLGGSVGPDSHHFDKKPVLHQSEKSDLIQILKQSLRLHM